MTMHWLTALMIKLTTKRNRRSRLAHLRKPSMLSTETLEERMLLSASMGVDYHEDGSIHGLDDSGNEWNALPEAVLEANTVGGGTNSGGGSPFDLSDTFFLNSNLGASRTIYLDFDGNVTSGTPWNNAFTGGADFTTPAYNTDGVAGFSSSELTSIQLIWQRVVEDYIAFDVNVTTQEPADAGDLINSGSGDSRWGVRVAIGGSSYDWFGYGAGGVAYIDSYNWNVDAPTFVFPDQLGNGFEKYVAEAVSHEAGHTLGLRHDGTATSSYYTGQGSGETAWAPIMGVGYYNNLTQWSRGEYANANLQEDDLAMITSQNGFGYRVDDFGDTIGTASVANLSDSTTIDVAGVIEQNTDVDVFSFTTGAGIVSFDVQDFEHGSNLDILAELYDSNGSLVTSANGANVLDAQLSASVPAGTYYLAVSGVGQGDVLTTGYSDYGSIGQYSFTGTIVEPVTIPTLSISDAVTDEGGALSFVVSLSEAASESVTVSYSTADGSATEGSDYSAVSGTLTFLPGELSKTVVVNSVQDSNVEDDESFIVNLVGESGATLAIAQGTGTIMDDDVEESPTVSISDASVREGRMRFRRWWFRRPELTRMTFTVSLSAASTEGITVGFVTADGSARVANRDYLPTWGWVTFNPGETSKDISVFVLGDNRFERNETFSVHLVCVSNADIDDGSGTGTIVNDDSRGRGRRSWRRFRGEVAERRESAASNAAVQVTAKDNAVIEQRAAAPELNEGIVVELTEGLDGLVAIQGSDSDDQTALESGTFDEVFVDSLDLFAAIDAV